MAENQSSNRVLIANGMDLTSFPSNYVSTTKYNLLNFLPFSLFIQFRRIANIYFLITAILQSIPEISPLEPFSAIAPLVFVLSVSMIREGIEDYLRYKSDKETNEAKTEIYKDGEFTSICYKDIRVGNLVCVHKDEVFPCDLIMLSNSNENGIANIETSSLDGEKNLKPRMAFPPTLDVINTESVIRIFSEIECDPPNARLYQFSGKINYEKRVHSLDKNHLLLCGAFLRNTEWAIGVSVYTGNDTKLRQNLMQRTFKQSRIEMKVNRYIILIILVQFAMCFVAAFMAGWWDEQEFDDSWYLGEKTTSSAGFGALTYFTYFLLLNTMLPISLIITLELVKLIQGFTMERDYEMHSSVRDRFCKVSSFSLNEELGMIEHVFSDKTGTLTSNKMEFKFCSIGCERYGEQKSIKNDYSRRPSYIDNTVLFTFDIKALTTETQGALPEGGQNIFPLQMGNDTLRSQADINNEFLRCLSLCHECLTETDSSGVIRYIGESPDEIALVDCARWAGYAYTSVKNNVIELNIGTRESVHKFERIALFEFDSDRKRNSVVLKDLETNEYIMYVKGADNVILERLASQNNENLKEFLIQEIKEFSQKGLRTLLMAYKIFTPSEFEIFQTLYQTANTDIDSRENKLADLADETERGLFLLGCTAVEDALQAEVPSTINDLLNAGIKVWMLTGDKMETAENIGKTCSLIEENMKITKIEGQNIDIIHTELKTLIKENTQDEEIGLIIDGDALEFVLFNEHDPANRTKFKEIVADSESVRLCKKIRENFFTLALRAKTIICCRATPGQKREVVKTMKNLTQCTTLAIGDGANDVSMILEAHIGIGLYGEEGMQAVQASDYAIGEFKFLWELLFVHGRYNYIRQSELILYFFYKNLVFTMPEFIFMVFCAYSGQTVYDDWYITCYNMVFTALPLGVKALFEIDIKIPRRDEISKPSKYCLPIEQEKDSNTKIRKSIPLVYDTGRLNKIFTRFNFCWWMGEGVFHSLVVFLVPFWAAEEGILSSEGFNHTFWTFSITSFSAVILVVNIKLAIYTRHWNLWHHIAIWLTSVVLFFGFIIVYDGLTSSSAFGTVGALMGSYFYYFCMSSVVVLVVVIDGGAAFLRRNFWKTSAEILMDYSSAYYIPKRQEVNLSQCDSVNLTHTKVLEGVRIESVIK